MGETQMYDQDFYAWAMKSAELLRQGRFSEIDVEHIAEELETMGRSERRELINRLAVLLTHLLKWRFQPERRGRSWALTIEEQRRQTARVLHDNQSLKAAIDEILQEAYGDAILHTARQTGLDRKTFPETCPFTLQQIIDTDFWPQ